MSVRYIEHDIRKVHSLFYMSTVIVVILGGKGSKLETELKEQIILLKLTLKHQWVLRQRWQIQQNQLEMLKS